MGAKKGHVEISEVSEISAVKTKKSEIAEKSSHRNSEIKIFSRKNFISISLGGGETIFHPQQILSSTFRQLFPGMEYI